MAMLDLMSPAARPHFHEARKENMYRIGRLLCPEKSHGSLLELAQGLSDAFPAITPSSWKQMPYGTTNIVGQKFDHIADLKAAIDLRIKRAPEQLRATLEGIKESIDWRVLSPLTRESLAELNERYLEQARTKGEDPNKEDMSSTNLPSVPPKHHDTLPSAPRNQSEGANPLLTAFFGNSDSRSNIVLQAGGSVIVVGQGEEDEVVIRRNGPDGGTTINIRPSKGGQ